MLQRIEGGGITSPRGFLAGAAQAGIKHLGRYDLALVVSTVPASAAGVFTANRVQAAPVLVSKEHLAGGKARGFVVNSGCANACTGNKGLEDARAMAGEAARNTGCGPGEMLVASTGVIGVPLPLDRVLSGIRQAAAGLAAENGGLAARAIMTTDTFPKEIAVRFTLKGKTVTIGGMAKGAGMIHPDMATLLGFIGTDAAVTPRCLQVALKYAADRSFNMVTVDRDTSTNDSVFALANGLAGNDPVDDEHSEEYGLFQEALTAICVELARMVARDGEGATRLVEVRVVNAPTEADARAGARSIAASNLVKAAIFGRDANWGRIVCALGYSGAVFDPGLVDVYLGDLQVAKNGCGLAFDEERAAAILAGDTVAIRVDLKQGGASAVAWGCDLTYDYVKINGAYRT